MVEWVRRQALRHVPAWLVPLLIVTALSITTALVLSLPNRFGPAGASVGMAMGVVGGAGATVLVLFVAYRVYRGTAYNANGKRWRNEAQHQ